MSAEAVDGAASQQPAGETTSAADELPRPDRGARARLLVPNFAIPLVLVLLFALFSIMSPDIFFTWANVRVVLIGQATITLLALAVIIPLRSGAFDLSVSATMILCSALVGVLGGEDHVGIGLTVVIAMAVGLFIGIVNGFFIVTLGVDAFIVTLGMLTLLTGVATALSNGQIITTVPQSLQNFANYSVLDLPLTVWIGWIAAGVVWYVFEFTPAGRYLLFIGGNQSAAELAGLRVARIRFCAFVAAAILSALAGVLLAGTLGSVDTTSGGAYLLAPYAAAFLGTTTIQLGRFNVVGTVIGIYLLAIGISGLQLIGFQGWIEDVFNGAALVLAVTFARFSGVLVRRLGRGAT
jgi:ribose transport system permease protein